MLCTLRVTTHRKNSTQITQMERICTDLKNWMLYFTDTSFSMIETEGDIASRLRCHSEPSSLSFRAVFVVIASEARNPVRCGCFTTLHSVQHDRRCHSVPFSLSLRAVFVVIASEARNPVWMLHFVQHDKKGKCASFSMTRRKRSFRTPVRNPVRCGCFTTLRSVQHDRPKVALRAVCHSERSEESSAWMLRFAQHDRG